VKRLDDEVCPHAPGIRRILRAVFGRAIKFCAVGLGVCAVDFALRVFQQTRGFVADEHFVAEACQRL
jgi:hypothetical protein